MKRLQLAYISLFCALLISCVNFSHRINNPNQFYGKNKVIKKESYTQSKTDHLIPIHSKTENPSVDSFNLTNNEKNSSDFSILKEDHKTHQTLPSKHIVDNIPLKLQKVEFKKVIERKHEIRTRKDDEEENKNDKTITTLFIVIFVLVILAGVLAYVLFQLMIKALNNAAEDAVEEACYIATMAYESYDHPKVQTFRAFRDQYLSKRRWGKKFILLYYKNSPHFVRLVKHQKLIKRFIRLTLSCFELTLRPFFKA